MKTKVFADCADLPSILRMAKLPVVRGFTTNPSLMKKAGVTDYEAFAKCVLSEIQDRPVSFEVFSDDFEEMHREAMRMTQWGSNVVVKIPITNTKGTPSWRLIEELATDGIVVNITAVMTVEQVCEASVALGDSPGYVSLFAGRIADTGRDPIPIVQTALDYLNDTSVQLIWASPREVLNLYQANDVGCHIITMTPDLIKKIDLRGKDLNQFSLETVKMFYDDGQTLRN